jgi:hypothetical protein
MEDSMSSPSQAEPETSKERSDKLIPSIAAIVGATLAVGFLLYMNPEYRVQPAANQSSTVAKK